MLINCYWWLATNKNRSDLYIFGFFSRVVLAKVAKVVRNILEIKVAAPESISLETAKLEFLAQSAIARATNTRPTRLAYQLIILPPSSILLSVLAIAPVLAFLSTSMLAVPALPL